MSRRFTNFITSSARRGWHQWSAHRVAMTMAKEQAKAQDAPGNTVDGSALPVFHLGDLESDSLDYGDRLTGSFTLIVGILGPFVLAAILSVSNGYFFAGFHDFMWNVPTVLAYAGGAILEAIGLAAIFTAQKALKDGTRAFFISAFLFALTL